MNGQTYEPNLTIETALGKYTLARTLTSEYRRGNDIFRGRFGNLDFRTKDGKDQEIAFNADIGLYTPHIKTGWFKWLQPDEKCLWNIECHSDYPHLSLRKTVNLKPNEDHYMNRIIEELSEHHIIVSSKILDEVFAPLEKQINDFLGYRNADFNIKK